MDPSLPERRRHYSEPAVFARISDFFGGRIPDEASAVFFSPGTPAESLHRSQFPLTDLAHWMDQGAELNRSLWDRRSLLAHLDLEYVNFDFPAEIYLSPERGFDLQEPVRRSVERILQSFGIEPLHLLTGRGHHFVWRLDRDSTAFRHLTELGRGRASPSLLALYESHPSPSGDRVSTDLASAFAGLGLVIEFLAHRIKLDAAPRCAIPVELAAIEVGGADHGRELVSVDITEYSDPIVARVIRVPFSWYLKPTQQPWIFRGETVALPPILVIPAGGREIAEGVRIMRRPAEVARLAPAATTAIPDFSSAMEGLVAAYRASPLARFHDWYYSAEHDPPESWPATYDRADPSLLPACVRLMLDRPNDMMLRPAFVERAVRVLLALGWHPRHIAGLIRSKYERDHQWGEQWHLCDPATRADFYARLFSGLFVTGVDDLVDFNCQSAREEGLCYVQPCNENLAPYRKSLLDRRQHERLAHRPLHGLFRPEQHL